jgi:hypothetical protein
VFNINVELFLCGTPCDMVMSQCCVQQQHVTYPLCAISDSHLGVQSLLHSCCGQRLFDSQAYRVWILAGFPYHNRNFPSPPQHKEKFWVSPLTLHFLLQNFCLLPNYNIFLLLFDVY